MSLITRFFRVPKTHTENYSASTVPNNDLLPLDVLDDSKILYEFADGTVLIHALLKTPSIMSMIENTEMMDPLSMEGVADMGLEGIYVGMDYSDTPNVGLFWFLPELAGTKTVQDGDGNDLEVDIVPRHQWGITELTL